MLSKLKIKLLSKWVAIFLLSQLVRDNYPPATSYSEHIRRIKGEELVWHILPSRISELFPQTLFEIEAGFEIRNYYWNLLSEGAKAEIRSRLDILDLNTFLDRFLNWFARTFPGAITDTTPPQERETIDNVREKIAAIFLKGSYIWGFKKDESQEEYRPYDFDLIIIVKDSDEGPRKLNLKRELTSREKEYLFGKDNPRAPPTISIIIIGEERVKDAGINYLDPQNKATILNIVSTWGAGALLAGTEFTSEFPPLWAWHASIKDIIKSAHNSRKTLEKIELTLEERKELQVLQDKSLLSDEEENRLRELETKYREELKWHFKLMKRILEANARIKFFETKIYQGEVYSFEFILNPFIGENSVVVINQMIEYGVTATTEEFFTSLETRKKLIEALGFLDIWIQKLESKLESLGIPLIQFP